MTRPPGMPDWIPDSCIIDGADLQSDDPEVQGEALKRVADAIVKKVDALKEAKA